MKRLYIIGTGPGNASLATPRAIGAIESCEKILATSRVGQALPQAHIVPLQEIYGFLANNAAHNTIGVLVSGDAGFFSASKTIVEKFKDTYQIEIINGINSLQYFASKLKIPYDDIPVYSLHGRDAGILGKVSYNKKIFVLTGGSHTVRNICGTLAAKGLGHVYVTVGENLSYENERIVQGRADEMKDQDFEDLAVMIIKNPEAPDVRENLTDEDFIRGDAPMTKEEIRSIVLAKLTIGPADILYDIGAGSGSVAVAMARRAVDGMVYAVEKDVAAVKLIEANRQKHKTFNLEIIHGAAPDALSALPAPHAVFIGGGGSGLRDIVAVVRAKNPAVRIVITAITLQTLQEITSMEDFYSEIICVNVSRAKKAGRYDLMMAQNPIYIVVAEVANG